MNEMSTAQSALDSQYLAPLTTLLPGISLHLQRHDKCNELVVVGHNMEGWTLYAILSVRFDNPGKLGMGNENVPALLQ